MKNENLYDSVVFSATMKYHNHIIKKVRTDLGESDSRKNFTYKIYDSKGKYINTALTLSTAKEYINSGYNSLYL